MADTTTKSALLRSVALQNARSILRRATARRGRARARRNEALREQPRPSRLTVASPRGRRSAAVDAEELVTLVGRDRQIWDVTRASAIDVDAAARATLPARAAHPERRRGRDDALGLAATRVATRIRVPRAARGQGALDRGARARRYSEDGTVRRLMTGACSDITGRKRPRRRSQDETRMLEILNETGTLRSPRSSISRRSCRR